MNHTIDSAVARIPKSRAKFDPVSSKRAEAIRNECQKLESKFEASPDSGQVQFQTSRAALTSFFLGERYTSGVANIDSEGQVEEFAVRVHQEPSAWTNSINSKTEIYEMSQRGDQKVYRLYTDHLEGFAGSSRETVIERNNVLTYFSERS